MSCDVYAEAPEGQVYVCCACGKRSKDMAGTKAIDSGWDESCMLNCQAFDVAKLKIVNNRVVEVLP